MTINLMLGDCLERMKEIPDGSVDLTVTSTTLRQFKNIQQYFGLGRTRLEACF